MSLTARLAAAVALVAAASLPAGTPEPAHALLNAEASIQGVSYPAWPSDDDGSGFLGGPIATRSFQTPLPGSRGPVSYDPLDPTSVGGDTVSILSWNVILGAVAQGASPTAIDLAGRASVWIPQSSAIADCVTDDGLTLCWDWPYAVDARGNLSGTGTLDISGTVDGWPILGTFTGRVDGKLRRRMGEGSTRVVLKVKLRGSMRSAGITVPAKFKAKLKGRIVEDGTVCDPASLEACLFGDTKLVMVVNPPGPGRIREKATIPYAQEIPKADGAWSLSLAVLADGRKLSGDASAELGEPASPIVVPFDVKGRYNPRRDWSRLRLRDATPNARGRWIRLHKVRSTLGDIDAAKVRFKLFGQKGVVEVPADPCCTLP